MDNRETITDERRIRRSSGSSIWVGVFFILLGGIMLLQRLGGYTLENWWALFILIPAISSLATAAALFRRAGRFNSAVSGSLFGGLIIGAVAVLFLFNLDWGTYWPIFVLLGGLSIMVSALMPPVNGIEFTPTNTTIRPWSFWIGLSAALLGLAFLLQNITTFSPEFILSNWWAIAVLIPAVGGLINALRLLATGRGFTVEVIVNLVGALIFGLVGLIALLGLNWNFLTPIILIGLGFLVLISMFVRK
jgi:hypothetical protein